MDPGMDPGPTITGVNLVVNAKVPGISAEQFQQVAEAAKAGCVDLACAVGAVTLSATLG
jgi:osmotically inducible protein OsmC